MLSYILFLYIWGRIHHKKNMQILPQIEFTDLKCNCSAVLLEVITLIYKVAENMAHIFICSALQTQLCCSAPCCS